MKHKAMRPTAMRATAVGGVVAAMLLLAGCGDGGAAGGAAPEGYERLKTAHVTVDFPETWKVQSEAERPELADGAAVLEQGGRQLGKISVVLKYDDTRDADKAAASALGDHELQAQIKGFKDFSVAGTDDGQRIDYSFKSAGTGSTPPKGEPVNGVDVVGTDKSGETFLVRINAAASALSADELEKVAKSVQVVESE
ncbi:MULTISPECIES: hypothetical protein [Streptomyces]|uniref:Lipoprotein n=1 Tax=Streptomyces solicathayae TaxID=3081768 RepID=A0ABZ0LU41_9ACTN|nr:hypothetical protein [Streptomyces sp. HUAS YS2]WOX22969.1 hypothetical protein R2D22_16805 [Streptomyces sp. HUAS YS2]